MLRRSIAGNLAANIKTDKYEYKSVGVSPCGCPVGAKLKRSYNRLIELLRYMSEERLERIENQLSQVIQAVGVIQQNMTVMQQNMMAMQNRMDSMEGTLLTTMTGGFNSLQNYIIDLDPDLAHNERKAEDNARNNRRLNQRLMRLENSNDNF